MSALDTQEVAKRYGRALLEISNESDLLDLVWDDAKKIRELISINEDFRQLIHSPLVAKDDQISAFSAVLDHAGATDPMKKFVQALCENHRIFILDRALDAFMDQVEGYKNIQLVVVRSAKALSLDQQKRLNESLKHQLGCDIRLDLHVDPSLKGGLSLEIGSKLIDNTITTKLNRYHSAMKGDA